MTVAVIINPVSGGWGDAKRARQRAERVSDVLAAHGTSAEVFVTERPGHARDLARAAASRGVDLVFAWGGDGTVNEVASALAFGQTAMGIIPAGSGNGLANELGIARHPERAIADALRSPVRGVDVGELGGRLFVNLAGVGLDAQIAARFNARGGRRRGLWPYACLALTQLRQYRPRTYTLAFNGERRQSTALLVCLANCRQFGNGAVIAPHALMDDGLLDVVVVEERSRLRTLCVVPRLFLGQIERVPGVTMSRSRHVTISADAPLLFHVDGEAVQGPETLVARVHPGGLKIRALGTRPQI